MRKKPIAFLSLFFLILLVYGFYLLITLLKTKGVPVPSVPQKAEVDVPAGEVIIKEEPSNLDEPYKFMNISLVYLKSFEKYSSVTSVL